MKSIQLNKKLIFVLIMFFLFFSLSIIIPFNKAPDEAARYLLPQYMYKYSKLPLGTDPEVRIPLWGFSYAFSPFLSYMIGGLFMKVVSIFSEDPFALLVAARFASVVFSTITVIYVVKIADQLFDDDKKWIFIILCSCLPMFIFISSYVNCDSLAVLSTSIIIYAWILGMKTSWNRESCIHLIIGLALCVLSYKNAYGYILVTIIIYFNELYKSIKRGEYKIMLKKGVFVLTIVFALAGWFYIRNYLLYGEFLADNISDQMSEMYAIDSLKPSLRVTPFSSGSSLLYMLIDMKWLEYSLNSFIGIFDYMTLPLPDFYYFVYKLIYALGIIGCLVYCIKKRGVIQNKMLNLVMVVSIIIPVVLSIYTSYYNGFQAQGRYLLPSLIPLMYFIAKGLEEILKFIPNNNRLVKGMLSIILVLSLYMILNVFVVTYII